MNRSQDTHQAEKNYGVMKVNSIVRLFQDLNGLTFYSKID